jgi:hypothetical protein
MNSRKMKIEYQRLWIGAAILCLIGVQTLMAQGTSGNIKWLRIGSLHSYFSEQNGEVENGGPDNLNAKFCWPGAYGLQQATLRSRAMWLGCRDFFDTQANKTFDYKVVGVGPRSPDDGIGTRIILPPVEFKLVGKFEHPVVVVDNAMATVNTLYDVLDSVDYELPADRMIVVQNHTAIGVTVTKKVYAFGQQYNDNYYVYDYVLKNTGIINAQGDVVSDRTIKDFVFYLNIRYAMAGESVPGFGLGWGFWNSTWGRNQEYDIIGNKTANPEMRAQLSWYGPYSTQPNPPDWGNPDYQKSGVMAAAKYSGFVILHADSSPRDTTDDKTQPSDTYIVGADDNEVNWTPYDQFNNVQMANRYKKMTKGHPDKTQAEEVGEGFGDLWGTDAGGCTANAGFGPYQLAPGDSIHIVIAEGVAGLSREKNREVGANWLKWINGTGNPALMMPNGSSASDAGAYKEAWVKTCRDSLMQTFRRALQNYGSSYNQPQPPPPPKTFTVNSGGDRIQLSWANNAETDPHFGGYVIYRSESNVLDPETVYHKLFECGITDVVQSFDDKTAVRGFNYYYYIQSKDDGTQNTIEPGQPLYSSMFWTLTNTPAYLRRPAGTALQIVRVVPNPYDIRSRKYQFGAGTADPVDRLAFYGLPPTCKIRIYTERGDIVWAKDHTNGAGDELWDSTTSSGQIVVSGVYILYVEVDSDTYAQDDIYANQDYGNVHKGDLVFQKGDLMFKSGDSVYRKFVIIR